MTTSDLTCTCGAVHLRVTGAPFLKAICYCASCRTAAERLAALPVQPPMVDAGGGTAFRMLRKDRVEIVAGREHLAEFRLSDTAKTRRIIATCCNRPLFLEFSGGHWLSVYNGAFPDADSYRADVLTQTGDAPDRAAFPPGVPYGGWTTARFFARLLVAWAAMGFRAPDVAVPGKIRL